MRGGWRAAVLAGVGVLGCARETPRPLSEDAYPFVLRAPTALAIEGTWRQEIVARVATREYRGTAILERAGDTVTVIGLTPMNTKAFVAVQRGDEVTQRTYASVPFPFPPRFMLIDVHRTYANLGDRPTASGRHTRTAVRDGEEILEDWLDGRLQTRTFRRLAADPPGEIRITYADWSSDGRMPHRVVLDNGWFGYRLAITTQALDGS